VPSLEAKFADPNELELGSFLLNEAWDAGLTLEFNNVTLRNPKSGGHILLAVSGEAKKGSLLGVMGFSGSGKSACPPYCAAPTETNTAQKQHLRTYSRARSELHLVPFC
jgi:ABC-type transport system involved in cytochrome bd biosynthesis fused ATPase/permease subunit